MAACEGAGEPAGEEQWRACPRPRSARDYDRRHRLLPAIAQRRTSGTASCGRSCGCRGASTSQATKTKRYDERLRMPKFPFNAERARSGDDVRARPDERAAGGEVHLPAGSAAAGDRPRPARARQVQLRRLPHAGHGAVEDRVRSGHVRRAAGRRPTSRSSPAGDAGRDHGLAHAGPPRLAARRRCTACRRATRKRASRDCVDADGVPIEPDDKESPPFFEFALYQPAVVSGALRLVGVQNLLIPAQPDGYGPANGTAYPTVRRRPGQVSCSRA